MVITIDGPSGVGKSSVARAVAAELGFRYLDTGAMYRCVALATMRASGADGSGERGGDAAALARTVDISVGERILLAGQDVTEAIRAPEVSERASQVASDAGVREALVAAQQRLLNEGDWVAEGRDLGTVVAPDAALKVFLTADPRERARRRAAELGADVDLVLEDQTERDVRDSTRAQSPLRAAPDAVLLDSTGSTLEQVVAQVVGLARGSSGLS